MKYKTMAGTFADTARTPRSPAPAEQAAFKAAGRVTRFAGRATQFVRRSMAGCAMMLCGLAASVWLSLSTPAVAAEPSDYLPAGDMHRPLKASMPPGTLGRARALGRGPIAGYFQPVAFSGPEGTHFALPQGGAFVSPESRLMAGLLIGSVYRFQITGIPEAAGAELYPTVEIIDRTYPPPGLATLYPIQINLDQEDLRAALDGQMVTRVVYLEDPQTALAVAETPTTPRTIDIAENQDPLHFADRFGRPVAIVRIGSLAPPSQPVLMPQFFFGHPTWAPIYQPEEASQP